MAEWKDEKMERKEILLRIEKCVNDIKPIGDINEEDYIDSRNIGFTSLQFLTFIVQVEEEFSIEFEDEELSFERYQNISDFVDTVEKILHIN